MFFCWSKPRVSLRISPVAASPSLTAPAAIAPPQPPRPTSHCWNWRGNGARRVSGCDGRRERWGCRIGTCKGRCRNGWLGNRAEGGLVPQISHIWLAYLGWIAEKLVRYEYDRMGFDVPVHLSVPVVNCHVHWDVSPRGHLRTLRRLASAKGRSWPILTGETGGGIQAEESETGSTVILFGKCVCVCSFPQWGSRWSIAGKAVMFLVTVMSSFPKLMWPPNPGFFHDPRKSMMVEDGWLNVANNQQIRTNLPWLWLYIFL